MTPKDMQILVMGDNRCWGKGDTLGEARKNAENPGNYVAWIVHPESAVNQMGAITYPDFGFVDYGPKEIFRSKKLRPKKK